MSVSLTHKRIDAWGRRSEKLRIQILRSVQAALGGIKELKVFGRETEAIENAKRLRYEVVSIATTYNTLMAMPRLLIESAFILAALLVVMLANAAADNTSEILPLLGLFAYAGFRIIPSANRVLRHLGQVRWGRGAIDHLYEDHVALVPADRVDGVEASAAEGEPIEFRESLRLEYVTFTYAGAARPALADVELTVRRGESLGIVGRTGAGKSTLVDVLLGLLEPEGQVLVDGRDVRENLASWQRHIGYVPQSAFLVNASLRRNIAFGLPQHRIDDGLVRAAASMAQLDEMIDGLPDGLQTRVGERGIRLSGGERQRVAIARALYRDPQLLVFDEATSALDAITERYVTDAIEALQGSRTLIIIAHRLSTVRACDRLLLLEDGCAAVVGTYDELLRESALFRQITAHAADSAGVASALAPETVDSSPVDRSAIGPSEG